MREMRRTIYSPATRPSATTSRSAPRPPSSPSFDRLLRTWPRLLVLVVSALTAAACGGSRAATDPTGQSPAAEHEASALPTPYERLQSPYFDNIRPADDMVLAQIDPINALDGGVATVVGDVLVLRLHVAECAIVEAERERAERPRNMPCRDFNLETFDGRRQAMLIVPAGPAQILVYNTGRHEDAGLWLRRRNNPSDTATSIGGVAPGDVGVSQVTLEPGYWLYSSPVSPTPDYLLHVR